MLQLLQWLEKQPLIGLFGAFVLAAILLVPLALKVAGLSPAQIVDVIRLTLQFFTGIVASIREDNRNGNGKK